MITHLIPIYTNSKPLFGVHTLDLKIRAHTVRRSITSDTRSCLHHYNTPFNNI